MKKIFKTFLITLSVVIILVGFYTYFSNTLNIIAVNEPTLTSSSGNDVNLSTQDKTAQDTAFIYTLTSLNTLKVDTSFFSDSLFRRLVDNSVSLGEPGDTGRKNPFLPINGLPNTGVKKSLVSNETEQITDKTVVLNGAVESTQGVTSVYFEYGTTEALGKATPQAKLSLIGSFSSTITGLTPKTTYYYRAVAKIDGVLNYGEIISFKTN